jgi:hypothetical protein
VHKRSTSNHLLHGLVILHDEGRETKFRLQDQSKDTNTGDECRIAAENYFD